MPSWWPWRRHDDGLGDGVWRAAADRLSRALRSYEHMAQGMPTGPSRDALERHFDALSSAVADGRAACTLTQAVAPSSSHDVPGGVPADLHKRLSRLGAEIAAAAEGAAMVRAGDPAALPRVGSRAARARSEAAALLELARQAAGQCPASAAEAPPQADRG